MRIQSTLIAAALLSLGTPVQARDVKEDPFAYEEREAEREREKEDAAEEAAAKQSFGNAYDFVISAERLVGWAQTRQVWHQTGDDNKETVDRVNVFTSGAGGDSVGYSMPRLAFDFFLARHFSFGGAFAYAQNSGPSKARIVTLAPRIGFAYMFGDVVGIWPRVGAIYQVMFNDIYNAYVVAGSFDLNLVLVASSHAAFTLGPRVDWSFTGKYDTDNYPLRKLSVGEYGMSAGLSLFF